jgi:hypothetical protein
MMVKKKENLLSIDGSNKNKVMINDFLLCKVLRKWLFER